MSLILFLIILVVLVLVHEFGHFITAKYFGMRVDEFGVGFPPKIVGIKKGETEYTINWIPFGGFVRIWGEQVGDGAGDPRAFGSRPKWAQAIVLLAGVTMNVILAWVLLSAGFMVGMPRGLTQEEIATTPDAHLVIGSVVPNSPAAAAGLKTGDRIESIVRGSQDFSTVDPAGASAFIAESHGEPLTLKVREGENPTKEIFLTPAQHVVTSQPEKYALGISIAAIGTEQHGFFSALWEGAKLTLSSLEAVAVGLGSFFVGLFTFSAQLSDVTGPVGIVGLVGDASSFGFVALLTLSAIISLNLAVVNLIPFPALDGGRLLFLIIEAVKRSPIHARTANVLNAVGFGLLLLLMVVVTFNDIARLLG